MTSPSPQYGRLPLATHPTRYDVYLPLDGLVLAALEKCAAQLRPALESRLGPNPALFELSGLSTPLYALCCTLPVALAARLSHSWFTHLRSHIHDAHFPGAAPTRSCTSSQVPTLLHPLC